MAVVDRATLTWELYLRNATHQPSVVPFQVKRVWPRRQQITTAVSRTARRLHRARCEVVVSAMHLHEARCVYGGAAVARETADDFSPCTAARRTRQRQVRPTASTERYLQYSNLFTYLLGHPER